MRYRIGMPIKTLKTQSDSNNSKKEERYQIEYSPQSMIPSNMEGNSKTRATTIKSFFHFSLGGQRSESSSLVELSLPII